jgi:hypothetical protein
MVQKTHPTIASLGHPLYDFVAKRVFGKKVHEETHPTIAALGHPLYDFVAKRVLKKKVHE